MSRVRNGVHVVGIVVHRCACGGKQGACIPPRRQRSFGRLRMVGQGREGEHGTGRRTWNEAHGRWEPLPASPGPPRHGDGEQGGKEGQRDARLVARLLRQVFGSRNDLLSCWRPPRARSGRCFEAGARKGFRGRAEWPWPRAAARVRRIRRVPPAGGRAIGPRTSTLGARAVRGLRAGIARASRADRRSDGQDGPPLLMQNVHLSSVAFPWLCLSDDQGRRR